jgi:hypothetical protein
MPISAILLPRKVKSAARIKEPSESARRNSDGDIPASPAATW